MCWPVAATPPLTAEAFFADRSFTARLPLFFFPFFTVVPLPRLLDGAKGAHRTVAHDRALDGREQLRGREQPALHRAGLLGREVLGDRALPTGLRLARL